MIERTRNANGVFTPVHGQTETRTFNIWRKMLSRCNDPKAHNWKWYGGKGIAVCDRWTNSFANFLADMGKCPDGLSIDRIKSDKGYEPGNCKWSTATEQARNCSSNVHITHNGRTLCISEWAQVTGIKMGTVWWRHKAGWAPERILAPVRGR